MSFVPTKTVSEVPTTLLKEIAVLECKNARKFSKLARYYIDFLNVSVLSVYITVVYIQRHTI